MTRSAIPYAELPTPAELRRLLRRAVPRHRGPPGAAHDPVTTGKLFWRRRDASLFADGKYLAERNCRVWNTRYAGAEAFIANDGKGYRVGGIHGRSLSAHRVIWALVHGEWPGQQIDHINGEKSDNRLANLRTASVRENARNIKRPSDNKSGVIGVAWRKRDSKWHAYIKAEGRHIFLGYFANFEEAAAARKAAEAIYGFHPNHGRILRGPANA